MDKTHSYTIEQEKRFLEEIGSFCIPFQGKEKTNPDKIRARRVEALAGYIEALELPSISFNYRDTTLLKGYAKKMLKETLREKEIE